MSVENETIEYPDYLNLIPGYSPIETNTEDYYFDEERAERAIGFIESLEFVEGKKAGQPFLLEEWQKGIIACLFGFVNEEGIRRYRKAFIEIPRKAGKSALLSAIMLYICFCDNEPGAQNYSVAADREQANIIYRNMSRMIERNSTLDDLTKKYKSYKSIEFFNGDTVFKSLSSDSNKMGLNIHGLIVDEFHQIKDRELIDSLITAQGARTNPLIAYITTAGLYDPESLCYKEYEYASNIRDGIFEDHRYLPVIFEATNECIDNPDYPCSKDCPFNKESFWQCEKVIRRANPNVDVSVPFTFFQDELKRAITSPEKESSFKRLYLNIWVQNTSRWLDMEKWHNCNSKPSDDKNLLWYGGLDLSKKHDLSTMVLVAIDEEGFIHSHCFVWVPRSQAIKKEEKDKVPYVTWARQGFITLTQKEIVDYDFIKDDILKIGEEFNIQELAVDNWQAEQIIQQLEDEGIDIIPFGQNIKSISFPSIKLEELVIEERLKHGDNPVLNWCASNTVIYTDPNENIKPLKPNRTSRIDCIIALIMAYSRLLENIDDREYAEEEIMYF